MIIRLEQYAARAERGAAAERGRLGNHSVPYIYIYSSIMIGRGNLLQILLPSRTFQKEPAL